MIAVGPGKLAELSARVADENVSVLDNLKMVRAGLYTLFDAALNAGDRHGGALLAGRIHENLQAVARLTGELANSPLVQHNVQNILVSGEFAEIEAAVLRALARHPQARVAVVEEFRRLELQHEAADGAPAQ